MAGRGMLTDEVQDVARAVLGREITMTELRLMPYMVHCLLDGGKVNNLKLDEHSVLRQWEAEGFLRITNNRTACVTLEFWTAMTRILAEGYVKPIGGILSSRLF